MDYASVYSRDYFEGKTSFFYKLGYGRFAKLHFDSLVRPLRPHLARIGGGAVLDVGCAYGFVLSRMPSTFRKFGVDVSAHAIARARERLPDAGLHVANAEDPLPFADGAFDVVLCNDVIEHLEQPVRALENVAAVIRPGGLLYLNTPNLNWLRRWLFAGADAAEHHVSLFAHDELATLLGDLGFDLLDHFTYTDVPQLFFPRFRSNLGVESAFICAKR